MLFRDPKTGKTMTPSAATDQLCDRETCASCPLCEPTGMGSCAEWVNNNPRQAAEMMGYEAVDQPRICEVLGVEVGERFRVDYPKGLTAWLHINEDGFVERDGGANRLKIGNSVAWAVNHPDKIIRKPRYTEDEVHLARQLCKSCGADAFLYRESQDVVYFGETTASGTYRFPGKLFPSLPVGVRCRLSEIAQ